VFDPGAFFGGFVTGLREGVEAALIVAIIAGYLAGTGEARRIPTVLLGAAAAVVVSVVFGAAIVLAVGELAEPWEQVLEATTMLIAAGIVTWMLFWMKRQSRGLARDLHARVDRALDHGGMWGLTILAFTAVIREGIETAVFLIGQASAVRDTGGAGGVLLGAILGLGAAVVIGYAIYAGSRRIDLRTFFRVSGVLLIFIAAGLLSRAVHELAEIGVITVATQQAYDLTAVLPHGEGVGMFLRAMFGYSASPEVITLVVWVTYVVVVLWLYLRPDRSSPVTVAAEPAAPADAGAPDRAAAAS
jgi:high-affinity iron transporter